MQEISAIIIDKDPTANQLLRQHLEEKSKIKTFKQFLKLDDGYDYACQNMPNLIFIDIEFGQNEILEVIPKILKNNANTKILLMGKSFDVQFVIKAKKAGMKETLLKPFIKNEIDSKVDKLINQVNYKSEENNKKIISIFSNKGGIGKTTMAVNLALEIANITKEPTVLVDFNSQFGDVSTFLNIKTDFGISYLLHNKEKINKYFLSTVLPKYKNTSLSVLSDSFNIEGIKDISLENIQDIIDALKTTFSYIIIDMTNAFDVKTIKLFDNSESILFPIVANMPNIRNGQRCLDFFEKIGYNKDKIKIILNRVVKNEEITAETIETTLNRKIYAKIQNDYFTVMMAINRGVGIEDVSPNSDLAKSFQNLAYALVSEQED